jgi:copper transport protein
MPRDALSPPALLVRAAAVLLVVLGVLLGAPGSASAHATLVSSDPTEGEVLPESPGEVTFTFDEPVSLVADGVQVFDAAGEPVEAEAAARDEVVSAEVPDDLADGTYVVTWRVVSSDGHPIAGSLTFSVGAPSEKVVPPGLGPSGEAGTTLKATIGVVQGVDYVALLLAGGLIFFLAWTVRGVRLRPEARRRLVGVLRAATVVAVGAAALLVPLSGAYQLGLGLGGLVDPTAYDPRLVGDDLLVLALQAFGLGLAVRLLVATGAGEIVGWVGAALAVWSPAMVGHSRAYEPVTLLVVTDAVHLTAGAVWLGGLVALAICVPTLAGRERDAAALLTRFTTVAAGLLAVLAITGVLMGWRILGSWAPLVETAYGRLLLVKVGIALVVVGVAAWNRFGLLPRMSGAGHDQRRAVAALMRRAVGAEAALLVVLLGVTGFLVQQPPTGAGPPAAAPGGTGVATGSAADWRVLAVLDAGGGRSRELTVQLQDETGEPIDLQGEPEVSLSSADVDLGQVPVEPVAAGTYRAEVVFPSPGTWEVQVSLPVDRFTNPVTTVELEVG